MNNPLKDRGLHETREDYLRRVSIYWATRCSLAEKYIKESPCDPDLNVKQTLAWNEYQTFLKENPTE